MTCDGVNRYEYDAWNRMVKVLRAGATIATRPRWLYDNKIKGCPSRKRHPGRKKWYGRLDDEADSQGAREGEE